MNHTRRLLDIAVVATLLAGMTSCRSAKEPIEPGAPLSATIAGKTPETRFNEIAAREGEWSELQVPVRLEMQSPMSMTVSGRAYMRRGKDIYVTMKVLGIEVASLAVTTDSVFASIKPGKKYLAESLSEVFGPTGLTVADIQDALTGRMFVVGKKRPSEKDMKITVDSDGILTAAPKKKVAGAAYVFRFTVEDLMQSLKISYGSHDATLRYADGISTPKGMFMQKAVFKALEGRNAIDATVGLDFGKAKWEVSPSVGWRMPKGYTRISGRALVKSLGE